MVQFRDWIRRLPKWVEEDRGATQRLKCAFVHQKSPFVMHHVQYETTAIVHGGITHRYRFFLSIVPWIQDMFAVLVLMCGRAYICSRMRGCSTTKQGCAESLIESTLAFTFVLEIDDLVYKFMLTPNLKRTFVNSIPEISLFRPYGDLRSEKDIEASLASQLKTSTRHLIGGSTPRPGYDQWTLLSTLVLSGVWVFLPFLMSLQLEDGATFQHSSCCYSGLFGRGFCM
jgi:hypothetical protein